MNAISGFTGAALRFGVSGDGVSIDPVTGQLSIPTDALRDGIEVLVTATNSGGVATNTFRVTVSAVIDDATVAPALVTAPTLSGTGKIGAALSVDPGVWSGQPAPDLALQWRRDGADIPGATASGYLPVAADDLAELSCAVTASNAAGHLEAVTDPVRVTQVAPVAAGSLGDLELDQGSGAYVVPMGPHFSGAALSFSVNGAGASIDTATGALSLPTDTATVAALITVAATNSGGSAIDTFRLTVRAVIDDATVAPALVTAPTLSGTGKIAAALSVDPGVWSGQPAPALALQWRRDGTDIPGATASGYLPVAADDLAEVSCAVTASNAAGSLEAVTDPVRVTQVAPAAAGSPGDLVLEQGSSAQAVPMADKFTGAALAFAVTGAGTSIDAATGILSLPTDALRSEEVVVVTATNSGGSAECAFRVTVAAALAAPAALGALGDAVYEQGSGDQTVSTQASFSGENLVFTLDAAPAGVVIDAGSGLVTVPTAALLSQAIVTVRASNAKGSATQSFRVTVRSSVTVFDAAAKLGDVTFLSAPAAPTWAYDAGGFAQLQPSPEGWAHGAWTKAAGDGRYRCLARWSMQSKTVERPFTVSGRVRQVNGNLFGIRLDAYATTNGERRLELRQYTGAAGESVELASVVVNWATATWTWVELEVEGTSVKGRIYAEAATTPDWQATGTTNQVGPGAFGPGGSSYQGNAPLIHIKRLEYQLLASQLPVTPSVPLDSDWTLAQFTERT